MTIRSSATTAVILTFLATSASYASARSGNDRFDPLKALVAADATKNSVASVLASSDDSSDGDHNRGHDDGKTHDKHRDHDRNGHDRHDDRKHS